MLSIFTKSCQTKTFSQEIIFMVRANEYGEYGLNEWCSVKPDDVIVEHTLDITAHVIKDKFEKKQQKGI